VCRVLHRPVDDYIEQDRLAGVSWSKNRLFTAECPFLSLENQYKPDGLDIIDHTNVLDIYKCVSLLDLNGINTRFQARLNAAGIFTPMEFYQAPLELLKKQVFQSILGCYWYLRLRGHKIDAQQILQALQDLGCLRHLHASSSQKSSTQGAQPKLSERLLQSVCETAIQQVIIALI
jgi:nucleotidyltransferase/DNA polymerase involved in DNA repair